MSKFLNYPTVRALVIHITESGLFTYQERLSILNHWQLGDSLNNYIKDAEKLIKFKKFAINKNYDYYVNQYEQRQIEVICLNDDHYPSLLKEIYQPPIVLFMQGDLSLLLKPSLSIVGSREITTYGQQALSAVIPKLSQKLVIVSGLAKGVDTTAHQLTMQNKGQTIAVIGTGLSNAYPRNHENLQQKIATNHLLISAFPLFAHVQKWHFVYRNRIIAGLSQATLVVEAANKSGSLITANYAVQENRDVFAVPGPINGSQSMGTNKLIQAGAKLVIAAEDILVEYTDI